MPAAPDYLRYHFLFCACAIDQEFSFSMLELEILWGNWISYIIFWLTMADNARLQKEAAQLDSVTDTVKQTELQSADTSKIQVAMRNLAAQQLAAKQKVMQMESELNKVKVSDEDVEIIADQFEIARQKAERLLKQSKGDLQHCIKDIIQNSD